MRSTTRGSPGASGVSEGLSHRTAAANTASGHYVVVSLGGANVGRAPISVDRSTMVWLQDGQENTYDPTNTATDYANGPHFFLMDATVNPGVPTRGVLAFDVPASLRLPAVDLDCEYGGGPTAKVPLASVLGVPLPSPPASPVHFLDGDMPSTQRTGFDTLQPRYGHRPSST